MHVTDAYPHLKIAGRRVVRTIGVLTLLPVLFAACSKPPPEAELANAGAALGDAATDLADLNTRIARTEKLLDELRADRREQRDKVRTLEERLEARATDVAVFRAVQTAILDEVSLQNAAIAVDVEERVVTLSGVVRSQDEARKAVAIARQTAGVDDVFARILIDDPQADESGGG